MDSSRPRVRLARPASPRRSALAAIAGCISVFGALASASLAQRTPAAPDRLHSGAPTSDAEFPVRVPVAEVEWLRPADKLHPAGSVALPAVLAFVGGSYTPPASERLDPRLADWPRSHAGDERPLPEVYAFLLPQVRLTSARARELEALGVRWLGRHGAAAYRVALPASELPELAAHPFVRWIGFARADQKLAPPLAELSAAAPSAAQTVWISLAEAESMADLEFAPLARAAAFDPDRGFAAGSALPTAGRRWTSGGWQARALAALGITIESYAPSVAAFRARVSPAQLAELLERDFVSYVEPSAALEELHDESTPLIAADISRASFSGSSSSGALVGMIDSGMWIAHEALSHAYSVSYDLVGSGYFVDEENHGTGVAHTILGEPPLYNSQHRGVAPGLGNSPSRRFRVVRVAGNASPNPMPADYDEFLDLLGEDFEDDNGNVSPKPHIVNLSNGVGFTVAPPTGTEIFARMVDTAIYEQDQSVIVAAGNAGPGPSTLASPGSAKNTLTVGGVVTTLSAGSISVGSSRGPTLDKRFKPNVCAPNRADWAQASSSAGYSNNVGTSVATPHVSGVAAQLVDHFPTLAYRPARLSSLLMATASPYGDEFLDASSDVHLNSYGMGRVDAVRANALDPRSDWINDSIELDFGDGATADFVVLKNCRRMIVVLHYVEVAGLPGAERALINDYDLWLDAAPFSSELDQGEFHSVSAVDNTEFVTIENPTPGNWRWKADPFDVPFWIGGSVKLSVTVHRLLEEVVPKTTLVVTSPDTFLRPGDSGDMYVTLSNTGRVASAQFAQLLAGGDPSLNFAYGELADGADAKYHTNIDQGWTAVLGNLPHGLARKADWHVSWQDEGSYIASIAVDGDNTQSQLQGLTFTVDGTVPGKASNFVSTTHIPNVWSKVTTVGLSWTAAPDNLSGIDGYAFTNTIGVPTLPAPPKTLGAWTSTTKVLASSASSQYFALRAVDRCSNWATLFAQAGPFKIDAVLPSVALNGPPASNQTVVAFSVTASDAHSGLNGMRFKLNNGAFTAWETVQTSKVLVFQHFTTNTVVIEVRDKALNTKSATKTIQIF